MWDGKRKEYTAQQSQKGKHMSRLWTSVIDFMWEACRYSCHQDPERSFFYKGEQLPVCARCSGVVVGQVMNLILSAKKIRLKNRYLLILLLPLGVDWSIQEIGIKESNNKRRFITGILGGFAVFGFYINTFLWVKSKLRNNDKRIEV